MRSLLNLAAEENTWKWLVEMSGLISQLGLFTLQSSPLLISACPPLPTTTISASYLMTQMLMFFCGSWWNNQMKDILPDPSDLLKKVYQPLWPFFSELIGLKCVWENQQYSQCVVLFMLRGNSRNSPEGVSVSPVMSTSSGLRGSGCMRWKTRNPSIKLATKFLENFGFVSLFSSLLFEEPRFVKFDEDLQQFLWNKS